MAPKRTTTRQNAFVTEYLVDLNGTQAAIRAGFSEKTAAKIAYQLLRKPGVAKAIQEAMDARKNRVEVKQDDVLHELMRIAMVDIGQVFDEHGVLLPLAKMPEDARRAIASIEVDEFALGEGDERKALSVTRKIKFWDKPKALELLGKHLKLFTDRVQLDGPGWAELVQAAQKKDAP